MLILALTLLFVLLMLIIFLFVFIYKIWTYEGWRRGLIIIAYFIISNFITAIILDTFNIKEKESRAAFVIVFFALWDFGLYIYIRLKEY